MGGELAASAAEWTPLCYGEARLARPARAPIPESGMPPPAFPDPRHPRFPQAVTFTLRNAQCNSTVRWSLTRNQEGANGEQDGSEYIWIMMSV